MRGSGVCLVALAILGASAGFATAAETPREALTQASFGDRSEAVAINRIAVVQRTAAARLVVAPADHEAALLRATATGYHAKLTGSRSEAIAARKQMEALVAQDPDNAEASLALGAWHLGAVNTLGRLVARAAVGARKADGLAALERAIAIGGNRAFLTGLSALLRLQLDPKDARGRALAEAAARATTPTALDRIMQRAAAAVMVPVRAGDAKRTRTLASRLLPLGQLPGS